MYYYSRKVKGGLYLYKGHNKKVNGVSKRVKDEYIGNYNSLLAYFQKKQKLFLIENQTHYEYGLSRAMYELSKQFMYEKIFQNNISKRTKDKYLHRRILIMVLNRIICPVPKYLIPKWYVKSDFVNYLDLPLSELEEQKIYRSMDLLDRYNKEVQEDVARAILLQEKLSFDTLYLDFTNQETYSKNDKSELLKKGHNKRKRYDLRQVNISLNCDAKSGIPFFHKSYPGNVNDPTFIKGYAPELRECLKRLDWDSKSTLIIDRGINGFKNFELLRDCDFDYIGGLIEDDFPQFFSVPKSQLRKKYTKDRKKKTQLVVKYTSQIAGIYGTDHLIITAYIDETNEDKVNALNKKMKNYQNHCIKILKEFKEEIIDKTFQSNWNNVKKIERELKKINSKLYGLFDFEIKSYRFNLTWNIKINKKNYEKHVDNLGKYVIFTNRLDLEPKEVMDYFYNKDKIEKNFQILKSNAYNYKHIIIGPIFHKRDDRVESHNFACILALQLYQVIAYRLKKKEVEISTEQALEELSNITCYYTKLEGNPFPIRHINPLTDIQKEILEALEVDIFI